MTHFSWDLNYNHHPIIYSIFLFSNLKLHPLTFSLHFFHYFTILISSLLISSISISIFILHLTYSIFAFLTITTQLHHNKSHPTSPTPVEISTGINHTSLSHIHHLLQFRSQLESVTSVSSHDSLQLRSQLQLPNTLLFSHKPQFLTPLKFLIFNNNS